MVYSPGVASTTRRRRAPRTVGRRKSAAPYLFIAVAVLGLATYGLSFGPVVDGGDGTGWNVRFAALAALCAAFGLLPSRVPIRW